MIHITSKNYYDIEEELHRQVDCNRTVSVEISVGNGDCTLFVNGYGERSCTTDTFWDEAWGRGGWFTETKYHFQVSDIKVECVNGDGDLVETDFDIKQLDLEW